MSFLNQSIQIQGMNLSDRLVMPPMATGKSASDGTVLPALCAHYADKTRGGHIGMVITEHAYVNPVGKAKEGQPSIARDSDIAGLKQLVSAIHQNGTKVMAQISHAGAATSREVTGHDVISASAVKAPLAKADAAYPREMSPTEIAYTISDFEKAAIRAREAGFDGVEIHSAHGYLLNQFYSPLTNKRNDAYNGATIEGRLRLHIEIIRAIRLAMGENYPLAIRLGACDYMPDGTTLEDSILAAQILEEAGVDLLDISGGFCGPRRPGIKEQGYFSELTEAIKRNVTVPVLLTGGITEAYAAEQLLKEDKADLIGVGRAILMDSNWAKNVISAL